LDARRFLTLTELAEGAEGDRDCSEGLDMPVGFVADDVPGNDISIRSEVSLSLEIGRGGSEFLNHKPPLS
jgi:hypothetical protein